MSVKKEDVHKLVDQMNNEQTTLAYKVLRNLIHDKTKGVDESVIADNSPLDEEERQALAEVIKEETVEWEDLKRELNL